MAKKRYRMTPRRRAALKKAQAASARKRRRRSIGNALKAVGAVGGAVGTAYASHHLNFAIQHPIRAGRNVKRASSATARMVQANAKRISGGKDRKPPVPKMDWSKRGYL